MKHSTKLVIKALPTLEKFLTNKEDDNSLSNEIEKLNSTEKTFLDLVNFYENPNENDFELQSLHKNLIDDWLVLALDSIKLFFEQDTYSIQNKKTHSLTRDDEDYLNQKQFVIFLNEKGQNYTEAKLSVYIQRKIIPVPDLVLSDTRYWLKDTCEKFAKTLEMKKVNEETIYEQK